ncbi:MULTISPECIES: SDR family NAD(P)-dependent oxidoreductase [Gracilibacillus]|uniref:SDR family NAD(P)-dependent oxidoreductase n=1 Tax=Gracilibacillus TaxID=74385 RepID=UPI0006D2C92B
MKTILITGSSSGIGKATAKYFAEKGWNVIATMRNPEKEKELTQEENVLVTKLDVTIPETIHHAIAQGISEFSSIDVVLNNAGYAVFGPFEFSTEKQIYHQFQVNVFGVMNTIKAILPHFKQNRNGLIINVSSIAGQISFPLLSLYHATKWSLEGFAESLQYELSQHNIKIKMIEPGNVDTDFTGRSLVTLQHDYKNDYQEYQEIVLSKQLESFENYASKADDIADGIYRVANDTSDQFRYALGDDAQFMLEKRKSKQDIEFIDFIRKQFAY